MRGFLLENRGGMFHETVLTACGKGWFAVTIKARTAERSAQASSDGDGMESCAGFTQRHAHHAADIACVVRDHAAASQPWTDRNAASAVLNAEEKRRAGAKSIRRKRRVMQAVLRARGRRTV